MPSIAREETQKGGIAHSSAFLRQNFKAMFRLGERVEHYYDGGESEHGARLNVRKKDVRIIIRPSFSHSRNDYCQ